METNTEYENGYLKGLSTGLLLGKIQVIQNNKPKFVCSLCGQSITTTVKHQTRAGEVSMLNPKIKNWKKIGEGISCTECYELHKHNKKFKFEKI